jgi:hypothetical protein
MSNQVDDPQTYKSGDIVFGSSDPSKSVFSATGAKLVENPVVVVGSENDLASLRTTMIDSIERNGGKRVSTLPQEKPVKKRKSRNPIQNAVNDALDKLHPPTPVPYVPLSELKPVEENVSKKLKTVIFENAFGRMRAKVEDVIEHDMAFLLVFSDEEAVVFEPKTGESLTFYDDANDSYEVYYPGVTFSWPDSSKKFMILFKIPEEN